MTEPRVGQQDAFGGDGDLREELDEPGIERRRTSVYAPPWLRLARLGRPFFPVAVDLVSCRELPRILREYSFEQAGLLGAGGHIEEKVMERSAVQAATRPDRARPAP